MNNSIQSRLLWGIGFAFSLALSLMGATAYHQAMHEIDEVFDAQLAQNARLIGTLASNAAWLNESEKGLGEVALPTLDQTLQQLSGHHNRFLAGAKYESHIAFQVWNANGERLIHSANTTPTRTDLTPGFYDLTLNGEDWVVFNLWNESAGIWVQTAQKHRVREELSRQIALAQIYPFALAFLPVLLLIVFVIRRALAPLNQLVHALEQRKPQATQPIALNLPKELLPIKNAINNLLTRILQYLDKEKRFVADAAHELRTPLSILHIHADNMLHSETRQQQQQAAQAVYQGTQRLTHLVNQLLALARSEQQDINLFQPIDFAQQIQDAIAQQPIALLERVNWQCELHEPLEINADPVMIQVVLRNLLENACKYATTDSLVKIELQSDPEDNTLCRFSLTNEVAGQLSLSTERMTDRFYRHADHQNLSGAGLGLSIVKQVIEAHQGKIELSTQTQAQTDHLQFSVRVWLPRNQTTAS